MATGRLTWQNVVAPDFSGAVEAQRASALAFDNAMQRLGGAVQTFDNNRKDRADAAVMRNALQYQNADELQAAIASGAVMNGVNPNHVRVDALLKAQAQAGQLMALDNNRQQLVTAKQLYNFNEEYNPLQIKQAEQKIAIAHDANIRDNARHDLTQEGLRITNASSAFNLNNAVFDRNKAQAQEAALKEAVARRNQMLASGELSDPRIVEQAMSQLGQNPNDLVGTALRELLLADFPEYGKPVMGAPGFWQGQPTLSAIGKPVTPPTALTGVPKINSPDAAAWATQALQANPALDTFIHGLGVLETSAGYSKTIKGPGGVDSNNPYNIKDLSGKGPKAYEKMEGSTSSYRQFDNKEQAKHELITMLGRMYPNALTARTPEEFAAALHNGVGGAKYATDPNHRKKVVNTIRSLPGAVGMPAAASTSTPGSIPQTTPQTTARPTAATMGVPQTTNAVAAAPAQGAPVKVPTVGAPTNDGASILAQVAQSRAGLLQSPLNTAGYEDFARALSDRKTTVPEAVASVVSAYSAPGKDSGLHPVDVQEAMSELAAKYPLLRSPAAQAAVIRAGGVKRTWGGWGDGLKLNMEAIHAKAREFTREDGDALTQGLTMMHTGDLVNSRVGEAASQLETVNSNIDKLRQQLTQVDPNGARARAIQSSLGAHMEQAAQLGADIESRDQMITNLFHNVMQGDPDYVARQQKAAQERADAAKRVDEALQRDQQTPATEADKGTSRTYDAKELTTARIARMSLQELDAIAGKTYRDLSPAQHEAIVYRRIELARQRREQTPAADEADAAKAITTQRIARMSLQELNAIVGKAYADLTLEQRAAMWDRRIALANQH